MANPTVKLSSGHDMPLLGLGTWRMDDEEAAACVRTAFDVGYTHIDTAKMYGNEAGIGTAIKDSGLDRVSLFITTKLPPEDAGKEQATLQSSLQKLQLDYLDLWLIHWPPGGAGVATWEQFIAFRDQGLVRSIGVSNYSTAQLDELHHATGEYPAVNQIKWGPALYDATVVQDHRDRNVVLEGYSPFRSTNLHDETLVGIAETHGVNTSQVILQWHVQHDFVAIPKSSTPERIRDNFTLNFGLTEDEMLRIDAMGKRQA